MNEVKGNRDAAHLTAQPGGLLMRWLDGEVTAVERARVQAHLGTCAACAREARVYRSLFRSLGTLPRQMPPAGLSARITSRVLAQNRALRRKRWFEVAGSVYVGSAAAVLIALIVSPLRTDVLAGGKTFLSVGLSSLLASFLGVVDRLLWLSDHVIRLNDKAHSVSLFFAPLARSLELVAAQPETRLGLSLALALTTALVWFLRQRPARGGGRMGDVAFL
jgi:anti-sigma factor RsiW